MRPCEFTAPVHHERHLPEQATPYRLAQQHAASFIAHAEASTGAELSRFIKDEFDGRGQRACWCRYGFAFDRNRSG